MTHSSFSCPLLYALITGLFCAIALARTLSEVHASARCPIRYGVCGTRCCLHWKGTGREKTG